MREDKAARVITFVERYCCQKNGQPIRLLPWQTDLIHKLYGTLDKDGLRVYQNLFCFVPRRNGKSTFFACLLIYELCCGDDAGEIYVLSNTITQSNDAIFAAVRSIFQNSPALQTLLKPTWSRGRITNLKTQSRIQVLSSTQSGLLGKDASVLCFDEIAFFQDRRLYANLKGSQLNRKQPLNLSITTASDNLEGIGHELYTYSVGVRDGIISDPRWLPVIYEAKTDQDWRQPEAWRQANPSIGVLFSEDAIASLVNEASQSPRKQSEFKQFHLNQWQHSSVCWLTKETWDNCAEAFSEDEVVGQSCTVGIDLARRHDMAAVVYCFERGNEYLLLPRFFLPREGIEAKEKSDHAPFRLWAEQGYLTLTDGDVIDYSVIRDVIKADNLKFTIAELGYDPWSGEILCNQLLRQEDGINCVEVRQRIDLIAPACMQFEKLLRERKIRHNNNPILNWHASNVAIRSDANGNIMPDKKHSKARFDGISASIIALSRTQAGHQRFSYSIF